MKHPANSTIELTHAFKLYDTDKNGTMDASEFKTVLKDLGKRDVTDEQVKNLLAEVDKNNDSVINWQEFLEVRFLFSIKMSVDVQAIKSPKQRFVL